MPRPSTPGPCPLGSPPRSESTCAPRRWTTMEGMSIRTGQASPGVLLGRLAADVGSAQIVQRSHQLDRGEGHDLRGSGAAGVAVGADDRRTGDRAGIAPNRRRGSARALPRAEPSRVHDVMFADIREVRTERESRQRVRLRIELQPGSSCGTPVAGARAHQHRAATHPPHVACPARPVRATGRLQPPCIRYTVSQRRMDFRTLFRRWDRERQLIDGAAVLRARQIGQQACVARTQAF
jgi:hypothetical protein